jgi:hypothetical protein
MITAKIVLMGFGLAVGFLLTMLVGTSAGQQARVEPPPPAARYQISSFSIGSTPGAYILDTDKGDVYEVIGKGQPELIGSVKTQPKKPAQ